MVSLLDTLSLTLIGVCWKLLQHRQAGEALQSPLVYVWRCVENATVLAFLKNRDQHKLE